MKIFRSILLCVAVAISASCSEKSSSGENTKSDKTTPEVAAKEHASNQSEDSSKPEADSAEDETSSQPEAPDIGEDCARFVSATKAIPHASKNPDCPECPATNEATEVLKLEDLHIDQVSPSGSTCEVAVTIRASFRPSSGGTIAGGLVGWIPSEQREQYSRGQTPSGQQVYRVRVFYQRDDDSWRSVEFDRITR